MTEPCRTLLESLLPRGFAWPRRPGSNTDKLLVAISVEICRATARVKDLLREAWPLSATPDGLLSDWERAYGLPEKCFPAAMTLQERRTAIYAKMGAVGRADPSYFEGLLERLGYYSRVDRTVAGTPHRWRVHLYTARPETFVYFRSGRNRSGDRLRTWERLNDHALCIIDTMKPLHTTVDYRYDIPRP